MKSGHVSRRFVVGALGAGLVSTASAVAPGAKAKPARQASGTEPESASAETDLVAEQATEQLVAPLTPGAKLARWTVVRIIPVENGAASVVVSDERGRMFQLDVCARDDSGPQGPGRTEHFDVFLANHGDGATNTDEEFGLAAMALADVIRSNEQTADRSHFKTLAERRNSARLHIDS